MNDLMVSGSVIFLIGVITGYTLAFARKPHRKAKILDNPKVVGKFSGFGVRGPIGKKAIVVDPIDPLDKLDL